VPAAVVMEMVAAAARMVRRMEDRRGRRRGRRILDAWGIVIFGIMEGDLSRIRFQWISSLEN